MKNKKLVAIATFCICLIVGILVGKIMQPKIADTGVLKDVKTDIESSSTNSNKTGEKDVGITIEEAREKYNISDPAIVLGINAMNTLTRISSATTF